MQPPPLESLHGSGRTPHPYVNRSLPGFSRPIIVALTVGFCLLAGVVFGAFVSKSDTVPYNLKKLIKGTGVIGIPGLMTAFLLLGTIPALAVRRFHHIWFAAWLQPLLVLLSAGLIAGLTIAFAPHIMVEKIAGSPVWEWTGLGWWLELFLRLSGLLLVPLAMLWLGMSFWTAQARAGIAQALKSFAVLAPGMIAVLLLGRTVVITWACTDNLTELIAGGGDPSTAQVFVAWPGEAYLAALFFIAALNIGLASTFLFRPSHHSRLLWGLLAITATVCAVPITFFLFKQGTVTSLTKYETAFSAAQFILGANRKAKLDDFHLLVRWAILYLGSVSAIGVGGVIGFFLANGNTTAVDTIASTSPPPTYSEQQTAEDPHQADIPILARWGIALAATLLIAYGSLVPFQIEHIPLRTAIHEYQSLMDPSMLGNTTRYDWVVNALLFGLLAFLWMTAFVGQSRSMILRMIAAPLVWTGVVVTGAAIEFAQLYVYGRTTCPDDVLTQSIGAAAGIALWLALGRHCLRPIGQLLSRQQHSIAIPLLSIYLVGYILYAVMPLDLVLTASEFQTKWELGQIRFLPFSYHWRSLGDAAWDLLFDVLLAAPIGYLLTITRGKSKSFLHALGLGVVLLIAIELTQLLMVSRVSDTTDILTGSLGLAIGILLSKRRVNRWRDVSARQYLLLAAIYAFVLLAVNCTPFDFQPDSLNAQSIREHLLVVPFAGLYFGSPFVALDQFLRKAGLALPLGLLLGLACRMTRLRSIYTLMAASLLAAAWLLLIEILQITLPDRTSDPTDAILGILGIIGGYVLAALFPLHHAKPR